MGENGNQGRSHTVLLVCVAIFVALCVLQIVTVREGHPWGGDFSLYLLHTQSITEGKAYTDIPWIYNTDNNNHSPRFYPPVYPLLIAPVYRLYGLNFELLKTITGLFLAPACLVLYALARRSLSPWDSIAVMALAGFSPTVFNAKDQVLPELPYILFSLTALWLGQQIAADRWSRNTRLLAAVALGLLVYLAYGSRSIGLVLPIAFVVSDVARLRKVTLPIVIMLGTFVTLAIIARLMTHYSDASYYSVFLNLTPRILVANVIEYLRAFSYNWFNGHLRIVQWAITALALLVAAYGYFLKLWRDRSSLEFYLAGYMALLLIWPGTSPVRYLIPVLPICMLYIVYGMRELPRPAIKPVFAIVLITSFATYAVRVIDTPAVL